MNQNARRGLTMPGILIVGVLIVVLGASYFSSQSNYGVQETVDNSLSAEGRGPAVEGKGMEVKNGVDVAVEASEENLVADNSKEEVMVAGQDSAMKNKYIGTLLAGTNELPLLDFNTSDYDSAVASGKLIVLYFYAEWCPLCKAEFPKMQAAFNVLPGISSVKVENVVGFKVNYKDGNTDESEIALAKEFGVPYQHTKVFVKNGQRILKAPDSWDMERYMREIISALSN